MNAATPVGTLQYIQDAYHRYYDTAFWLRDPSFLPSAAGFLNKRAPPLKRCCWRPFCHMDL